MGENENFYKNFNLDGLTKELLLTNKELVLGLVKFNDKFGEHPLVQDMDILSLDNWEIAWRLALRSGSNGWGKTDAAQDINVLSSERGKIAVILAENSIKNGWGKTPAAQDFDVLSLGNGKVAELLAIKSDKNGWGKTRATRDLEVLKLRNGNVGKELGVNIGVSDGIVNDDSRTKLSSLRELDELEFEVDKLEKKLCLVAGNLLGYNSMWGTFRDVSTRIIGFFVNMLSLDTGKKEIAEFKKVLINIKEELLEAGELGGINGLRLLTKKVEEGARKLDYLKDGLIGFKEGAECWDKETIKLMIRIDEIVDICKKDISVAVGDSKSSKEILDEYCKKNLEKRRKVNNFNNEKGKDMNKEKILFNKRDKNKGVTLEVKM